MADLQAKGADGIFRGQKQRNYDFRTGGFLGKQDHIVRWKKPVKPKWMARTTYEAYPDEIRVREFKVAGKVYVTTFFDSKKYNKKELTQIYEMRWQVEINLKSIKSVMNMDMLSRKTPEMMKKEIGIHFLAYNFIRVIIAEACSKHNAFPNRISFKGTVQLLNKFMPCFADKNINKNKLIYAELLRTIIKNAVGNRPGRMEPRVIKPRRKPFPALNRPKIFERQKLMKKMKRAILKNAFA